MVLEAIGKTRMRFGLLVPSLFVLQLSAQEFEVASVRPTDPTTLQSGPFANAMRLGMPPNGISFGNADLFSIILLAYDIDTAEAISRLDFSKFRGADSILGTQFDIEARGVGDRKAMLRNLLAQRFGLKVHTETRMVPVYVLRVKRPGRLGPNLKPTSANCQEWFRSPAPDKGPRPAPCENSREQFTITNTQLQKSAGTMVELARVASGNLREPVRDETGLTGNFAWEVRFARRGSDSNAPTLLEAFEDQLGLTLERTKGPWEVLVIDAVRMPTPN